MDVLGRWLLFVFLSNLIFLGFSCFVLRYLPVFVCLCFFLVVFFLRFKESAVHIEELVSFC